MSDNEQYELLGEIMNFTCSRLIARTAAEEGRWGRTQKTVLIRALIATAAQLSIAASAIATGARAHAELARAERERTDAVYLSCDLIDWAELLLVNPGSGYPVGHPDWVTTRYLEPSKFPFKTPITNEDCARGIFLEASGHLLQFAQATWLHPREPRVMRFLTELHSLVNEHDSFEFKDACITAFRRVR